MTVSFDVTQDEMALIKRIAERVSLGAAARFEIVMDLTATHANGCPLDLERLLAFDDANLKHDLAGIARYLNRDTGQLESFFRPRCAQRSAA